MGDLIRRQDAIDALHQYFADGFEEDRWWNSTHVLTALEQLPSVEPVRNCNTCRYSDLEWYEEPCDSCTMGGETNHYKPSAEPVRCKDCKFYDHFWNGDWCSLKNIEVKDANDFCSRAERRTDE